ncbi:MAG: NADH-quinone oxidoreductase subunit NuoF [Syntrophorhabdus sp.]
MKPLTQAIRPDGEPLRLKEYESHGGFEALRKALKEMSPPEVIQELTVSNLRGRGGAGFPTGAKWAAVPPDDGSSPHRYVISNSDEMEPGAFKDKLLMEGNPLQLIEGLIIAGYATRSDRGYIFLRWAYGKSAQRMKEAIGDAYKAGYLGRNILNSGYNLDIYLHISAGRYICGEETALLNSIEGKRPIPRGRPPFPQVCGLWGCPAVVNNAETLSNVPHIIRNGADWYKALSLSPDGGTKIYAVSGRVKNPGAWELPMGTTIRELLYDHAGGMKEGFALKGIIPGGASTDFLLEEHLDTKMDYDSVQKAGSRLGTGTMIILDDKTCPVGMVHNLEQFFSRESCGWCTPCREGLPWIEKILKSIEDGNGLREDIGILEEQTKLLRPGNTFCVHAPGAMEPLQSALKFFRADFERHIEEGRCPYR